jgi:S-adenosylmethionine-dependent methyltransferase
MSQVVRDYYDDGVEREWCRLDSPLGRIEFASTLRLIDKYFPASGTVCDVGGGPGRYTLELARRAYRVTLVELSEGLLARARVALDGAGVSADRLVRGDACELAGLSDAQFDAALLLGPLYHLVDRPRRMTALGELRRVLKPGGVAIAAYLNSWGILRAGLGDFPERYADPDYVASLLGDKTFRGAESLPGFTECYWATPDAAEAEVREAGLGLVSRCGAEGFAGGMRPAVERLASEYPHGFDNLVRMGAETSELPQYRDATEHLHLVVRKPVDGGA